MTFVMGRIGRCIYCGSTAPPLTDEHIVPLGLGGDRILAAASCLDCQRITSGLENELLHKTMQPWRTALGVATRHPKKRPTHLKARIKEGSAWKDQELPVGMAPTTMHWPRFLPPAVLDSRPFQPGISFSGIVSTSTLPPAGTAGTYELTTVLQPTVLARVVAKIGYGFAVAERGLGSFEPVVLPAILGTSDDIGQWVGCLDVSLTPGAQLTGSYTLTVGDLPDGQVISVVQLFAGMGVPEYVVVVGKASSLTAG
jgi:hypothetical protein